MFFETPILNLHEAYYSIVTFGKMGINGYLTKFKIDSLNDHTDFTTASLTMNALSAGTDDIISQSGVAKPQSQIFK